VIEAKTVILADGVNSILAEKLGMAKRVKPTDCGGWREGTDRVTEVGY